MFVTVHTHMRDKISGKNLSPVIFTRHLAAMLNVGLFWHQVKIGLHQGTIKLYIISSKNVKKC